MTWQVIEADCVEAMREMDEASVDAVVCDPPYGIGFMNKGWDSPEGPEGWGYWAGSGKRPVKAEMHEFQAWSKAWATEALRVLKPGGHLLAFGGTRTYHRLACAVEDAGFEIRDSVIWLYGSGFPKSLDVSKAMDRANEGRHNDALKVTQAIEAAMRGAGMTRRDLNREVLGVDWHGGSAQSWTTLTADGAHKPRVPEWGYWLRLKELLDLPDDMDAEVWRLNGRKGQPGENWEKREKVGERSRDGKPPQFMWGEEDGQAWDVTAPATPEAQRWQGWGTALKPAFEPVVCAQKPLGMADWLVIIGSHLERLEAEWQAQEVDPTTPTGEGGDSSGLMDTSPSESEATTPSSIVTSWRSCWAELLLVTSTFTTEMGTGLITDLRTLSSCLEAITVESIQASRNPTSGSPSPVEAADNLFGAAVLSLRGILALSADEPATESTAHPSPDGGATSPSPHEPIVVARKPLIGTVAQNVERFGTGALNIAATRIGGGGHLRWSSPRDMGYHGGTDSEAVAEESPTGRWPANVALSCDCPDDSHSEPSCAVAELDRQSGERRSAGKYEKGAMGGPNDFQGPASIPIDGLTAAQYSDSGSASRFFATFSWKYQAKASRAERDSGLGIDRCTCETSSEWVNEDQPVSTPPDSEPLPPRATTAPTSEDGSEWSTTGSGSSTMDQSQMVDLSTTETDASRTTESRTSSSSTPSPTSDSTRPITGSGTDAGSAAAPSAESGRSQTRRTSTSRAKVGSATADADPATSESSSNRNSEDARCASCGGVIGGALRNAHPT